MTTAWRIWYDDGSTFDSTQGPPEAAPLDGVIAVGTERENGHRRPRLGADYYFWTGDGWAVGDRADLERWLRRDLPALKYGRWARNDVFTQTQQRVREWVHGN